MRSAADIVRRACQAGLAVPAFNVPHLPMVEPVIRAVRDTDAFALVETARLEWIKFEARGPAEVAAEFARWNDPDHVRLHLDHVPVVDEDGARVDALAILRQALDLGYGSVMVDGSRLPLEENIRITSEAAALAHAAGAACEAELGAVLGHEAGPLPPYEELFASGRGFTDVAEARRFAAETSCDWLSVAIGNIHGAVSEGLKDRRKVEARLDLAHLARLRDAVGIPLVLHGGSGIRQDCVLAAISRGIAKVNVGTELRQAYEEALTKTGRVAAAQDAVHARTTWMIRDYFHLAGKRTLVNP